MARGSIAKDLVVKKMAEAFGADWIGEVDKKYFVWADDGGERVQIAIALTCPKTFVDAPAQKAPTTPITDFDWSDDDTPPFTPTSTVKKTSIDKDELDKISEMMAKFGL